MNGHLIQEVGSPELHNKYKRTWKGMEKKWRSFKYANNYKISRYIGLSAFTKWGFKSYSLSEHHLLIQFNNSSFKMKESWPSRVSDHLYPSVEQPNIVNHNICTSVILRGRFFFSQSKIHLNPPSELQYKLILTLTQADSLVNHI